MTDLMLLSLGALSMVLGGAVKGTIGVGLPLVVIPLMSLVIPSPQAIGLMVMPVLLSNIWQAYDSGLILQSIKRFAPLLITQAIASIMTVKLTLALSIKQLNTMLAAAVILSVVIMAFKPVLNINAKRESRVSAFMGFASGILGGVSTLTGPVIITYLMALKLSKDEFVSAVSVIYFCGALPLFAAMFWFEKIGIKDLGFSTMALLPMFIGLALGKRMRGKLNEDVFRKLLFAFLVAVSVVLLLK
jgi:uncharacterized protein